jgi:hypothetical protein
VPSSEVDAASEAEAPKVEVEIKDVEQEEKEEVRRKIEIVDIFGKRLNKSESGLRAVIEARVTLSQLRAVKLYYTGIAFVI